MANPRFAWGIDIGNRALKAVKLVRDGDALRVDDFEFIEHETILSQAGDNRESLIQTALANFVQRHGMKGGVVGVGVSGQASFARFVKLPPVDDKKIPEIVRFEAIQQIPFPLDDVEWSYQLFRQEDNPEVEVGIFAMRKDLVNQHIKYFTDFDLNVQTVQMNPLAVYNAMRYDGRFDDGVAMVVDVGTDNTDLLIADNHSIWMRSIPIGGSNFTEALVKAFKLNFVKAEDLKRNAATSKYARQIFQHMRPVFADLVAEVQRSIGFYSSVHRDAKINKIFALGGTFKLPGLQKYLQQNLQLPVERLDSLAAGAPADPKHAASFGDNLLSIVGAYGLAIQAMGASEVTSSLLPRAIQRERMWQDKTKWFGLAAACFVAGATIYGARYFLESMQWENARGQREQNRSVLSSATDLDRRWTEVQNAGEVERQIAANIQRLTDGKNLWRDLVTDLTAVLPQPPEPLRSALASGNAAEIKKTPRDQRRVLRIESMTSVYDPALMPNLNANPKYLTVTGGTAGTVGATPTGGQEGAPPPTADPSGKGRGFVVTLRMDCPLAKPVAFVENDVRNALLSLQPSKDRKNLKYAVRKVEVRYSDYLYKNSTRMGRLKAAHDAMLKLREGQAVTLPTNGAGAPPAGGGFGSGGFGAPPPAAAPNTTADMGSDPAYQDRVTGEFVGSDYEFEIVLAVEIDPEPWKAPEPGEQTASNR